MDSEVVPQLRFDIAHCGMLNLFSKQTGMPVVYHLILDRYEIITGQDIVNDLVCQICASVSVFLIGDLQFLYPSVMIAGSFSVVFPQGSVYPDRCQFVSLTFRDMYVKYCSV